MKQSYLILVLFLLAGIVFADENNPVPETTKGLGYKLINNDTEYSVEEGIANIDGVLIIPATHNNKKVTVIPKSGFSGGGMAEIVIPENITTIGERAFNGSDSLVRIAFSSSVKTIGAEAFSRCANLQSVTFTEGLVEIGSSAFSVCERLEKIETPSTLVTIGANAFDSCSNMKEVVFKNGLITIGDDAFIRCTNIINVVIPDSVENINTKAFYCCENIKTLTISKNAKKIGVSAFSQCNNLVSVTVNAELPPVYDSDDPTLFETNCLKEIRVPAKSVDLYKSTKTWEAYADWIVAQ